MPEQARARGLRGAPGRHRAATGLLLVFAASYPFLVNLWVSTWDAHRNPEKIWLIPRLVVLLAAAGVALLHVRPRLVWATAFGALLLAHLGLVSISALAAQDAWSYTLLGEAARRDGVVYQVALALLAIWAYQVLVDDPAVVPRLLGVLVASGAAQGALVLAQRLGLDPIGRMLYGMPIREALGTLGSPAAVAGLLLPVPLAGVGLALHSGRAWPRGALLVGLVLAAAGLAATGNRAAMLGLLAALSPLVVYRRNLRLVGAIAALGVALLGALSVMGISTPASRYLDFAAMRTSMQTRLAIWKLALDAERRLPGAPWLGGGPNAFRLALLRHVPPERLMEQYRLEFAWAPEAIIREIQVVHPPGAPLRSRLYRVTFEMPSGPSGARRWSQDFGVILDKAHNLLLDRLLSYGMPSVLVWLALYLVPVLGALRSTDPVHHGLAAALFGTLVYYMAWLPLPTIEPIHLLLVAAAWAVTWPPRPAGPVSRRATAPAS